MITEPPAQRRIEPQPPEAAHKPLLLARVWPILLIVALCWLMFLVNNLFLSGRLISHGIAPRHLGGITGIIWAPFLHGSFSHLAANTLPLLILGGILCLRSRAQFALVTVAGIIPGGVLVWIFGHTAYHIGASGLIFCYFGYLTSLAYFHRSFGTLLLSVACIIAYGGMLKGILTTSPYVSWEGHLAGLIAGVAIAWLHPEASNRQKAVPPVETASP